MHRRSDLRGDSRAGHSFLACLGRHPAPSPHAGRRVGAGPADLLLTQTFAATHLAAARCNNACPCHAHRTGTSPGICAARRGCANNTTSDAPGTRRASRATETGPRSPRPFHERGSAYTRTTRSRLSAIGYRVVRKPSFVSVVPKTSRGGI